MHKALNPKWLLVTNIIPIVVVLWMYFNNHIIIASLATSVYAGAWFKLGACAFLVWLFHSIRSLLFIRTKRQISLQNIVSTLITYFPFWISYYALSEKKVIIVQGIFLKAFMLTMTLLIAFLITKIGRSLNQQYKFFNT